MESNFNYWAIKFNDGAISLKNLIVHLAYLGSFNLKYTNGIIGVEWTLNIEVFYYLVIGYFVATKLKTKVFYRMAVALILAVLITALFDFLKSTHKLGSLDYQWLPFRYAWMFLFGGVGYYGRNIVIARLSKPAQHLASNVTLLACIACVLVLLNVEGLGVIGIFSESVFVFLTFFLLVFCKDDARLSILLTNKLSVYIGTISFSFYLLHYIVLKTKFAEQIIGSLPIKFLLYLLATIVISHVWCKIFEMKFYNKAKTILKNAG